MTTVKIGLSRLHCQAKAFLMDRVAFGVELAEALDERSQLSRINQMLREERFDLQRRLADAQSIALDADRDRKRAVQRVSSLEGQVSLLRQTVELQDSVFFRQMEGT